jgi:hypothetical protein
VLFPGRWLGMSRDIYEAITFPLISKNKEAKKY